jgi:hypothetical protein
MINGETSTRFDALHAVSIIEVLEEALTSISKHIGVFHRVSINEGMMQKDEEKIGTWIGCGKLSEDAEVNRCISLCPPLHLDRSMFLRQRIVRSMSTAICHVGSQHLVSVSVFRALVC